MGGLLILFVAALYIFTVYWIAKKIKSRWGKIIVTIFFVLVPTADAIYGRFQLKLLCEKDGGLKINRSISNVDGFLNLDMRPSTEWLTKFGFEFVEGTLEGGLVDRVTLLSDGQILEEKRVQPRSKFTFSYEGGTLQKAFSYGEYKITNSQNKEILATHKNVTFQGGWVERIIAGLYASEGYAGSCIEGKDQIIVTNFITRVLNPIHKK